jgi:hypothetical protein
MSILHETLKLLTKNGDCEFHAVASAGVLTCDPRVVRDARVVSELTFDEATELSYFGAQVRPNPSFPL